MLVAAYTLLAVAAGSRAVVQLATKSGAGATPYVLTLVAAVVYVVLALALRRTSPRARLVATAAAAAELAGVLAVGTVEQLHPWQDSTVWSGYGEGYLWLPPVLPIASLVVLGRSRWRTSVSHGSSRP